MHRRATWHAPMCELLEITRRRRGHRRRAADTARVVHCRRRWLRGAHPRSMRSTRRCTDRSREVCEALRHHRALRRRSLRQSVPPPRAGSGRDGSTRAPASASSSASSGADAMAAGVGNSIHDGVEAFGDAGSLRLLQHDFADEGPPRCPVGSPRQITGVGLEPGLDGVGVVFDSTTIPSPRLSIVDFRISSAWADRRLKRHHDPRATWVVALPSQASGKSHRQRRAPYHLLPTHATPHRLPP